MIAAFIVALLAGASAPTADASGPRGDFTVVAARLDRATGNAQARYAENDPQLVGRIVSFVPGKATYDGYVTCPDLKTMPLRGTAGGFFRQVFPKRVSPNYAPYPQPADFRLPISSGSPLSGVRFRCGSGAGDSSASGRWSQAAAFPLPGGRWGLEWEGDLVLVLVPRPRGTPTRASFDCAKAATPVERTICADPVLASWDQSVAAAYRAALSGSGGDTAVADDQKRWLTERAKCRTNRTCLYQSMSLRTANLAKAG